MSAPLVLAVPAKGRLQGNTEAFFSRAGLALIKPRGARDYRGAIASLEGVEVAYLSASEITSQLAAGAVHLGVTGEDLVREIARQHPDYGLMRIQKELRRAERGGRDLNPVQIYVLLRKLDLDTRERREAYAKEHAASNQR